MKGLILETARWRQWYQETNYIYDLQLLEMIKHSIPPFSRSRI